MILLTLPCFVFQRHSVYFVIFSSYTIEIKNTKFFSITGTEKKILYSIISLTMFGINSTLGSVHRLFQFRNVNPPRFLGFNLLRVQVYKRNVKNTGIQRDLAGSLNCFSNTKLISLQEELLKLKLQSTNQLVKSQYKSSSPPVVFPEFSHEI